MSTPKFASALAASSDYATAPERIRAIKRAIAGAVQDVDPTAEPTFTDYFNHSVVPDIVLRWPREREERLLFVRGTNNLDSLLDSMPYMNETGPIVITLEDFEPKFEVVPESLSRFSELDLAAHHSGTWLADPSALETVASSKTNEPVVGLLGQALTRGGAGLTPANAVQQIVTTTVAGFKGAGALDAEAAQSAVDTLDHALNATQSGRLTRVLRAVWEGHGGSATTFPATESLGALTDEDIRYLLEHVEEDSPDFWYRVGRSVPLDQIVKLRVPDYSANLQLLLGAMVENVHVKGVRVLQEPPYLGEVDVHPRWIAERGQLALRGKHWTAYVAISRAEELPPSDGGRPLRLAEVRRRVALAGISLTQIEIGANDRKVTYESKDGSNVVDDDAVDSLIRDLKSDLVEVLVFSPEGGGAARADLPNGSVIGQTNSTFLAAPFLRACIPLLVDVDQEERSKVTNFLSGVHAADPLIDSPEE